MKQLFAQKCYLANVYASYALVALLVVVTFVRQGPVAAAFVAAVGVVALAAYVRAFPGISRWLGYGSVADLGVTDLVRDPAATVRLYTAIGCPFCPIVRERLRALCAATGTALEEIDVTLRPDILVAKGIRAVPVVEAGGRVHVGHATTAQLAALVSGTGALLSA